VQGTTADYKVKGSSREAVFLLVEVRVGLKPPAQFAQHGRCASKQTGLEARRHEVKLIVAFRFSNATGNLN